MIHTITKQYKTLEDKMYITGLITDIIQNPKKWESYQYAGTQDPDSSIDIRVKLHIAPYQSHNIIKDDE